MKALTHLTAEVADVSVPERPITSQLHIEPVPGFFIRGQLGADGLVLRSGDAAVLFPLADLLAAAQRAEPALVPPKVIEPPDQKVSAAARLAAKLTSKPK